MVPERLYEYINIHAAKITNYRELLNLVYQQATDPHTGMEKNAKVPTIAGVAQDGKDGGEWTPTADDWSSFRHSAGATMAEQPFGRGNLGSPR